MSRITDRPTPEWEAQQGGNVVWSGLGRGEEPHLEVLFYCPFDVLMDMDGDEFAKYQSAMGRFNACAYAWDILNKSNNSRLNDLAGQDGEQDLATVYSALLRHMITPHIKTCRMLVEPFSGGMPQIRATRPYLFGQMQQIIRALAKLEDALEKIDAGDYARPKNVLA